MQRSYLTELYDATRNKKQKKNKSRFETHVGSDAAIIFSI